MKTSCLKTTNNEPQALTELYKSFTGNPPVNIRHLTGSASSRQYFRLTGIDGSSLIGVEGVNIAENEAFLYIDETLRGKSVNLPRVIAKQGLAYLQEDLGTTSLYDIIEKEGFSTNVIKLCKQSLDQLLKFQTAGKTEVDTSICYPVPAMKGESINWDLNYFKYCFVKLFKPDIDEVKLEIEFSHLRHAIEEITPQVLIHRDFQSRNIMIHEREPWLIDFQGARRGPATYDLVSFLWQARLSWPEDVKRELIDYYIRQLAIVTSIDIEEIKRSMTHVVMFRMMQVLGAYGYRGIIQHNGNFNKHIPIALDSLRQAIITAGQDYSYLLSIIDDILVNFHNEGATPQLLQEEATSVSPTRDSVGGKTLTVTVSSFSYKKGLPVDTSGNGGGFVFDCRAIHNPGRYDRYKSLTGDDLPVIEFLENEGEIETFLDHCKALVGKSVERYLERGFENLNVAFGCTGGQHRSVYSASHMARYLAEAYNVRVVLIHREQNIHKIL